MNAIPNGPRRRRLPNRRAHLVEEITIAGTRHIIGFGASPHTQKIAEVFISAYRVGTPARAVLDDGAVAISLLLQSGFSAADLARRFTPDSVFRLALQRAAAIDADAP